MRIFLHSALVTLTVLACSSSSDDPATTTAANGSNGSTTANAASNSTSGGSGGAGQAGQGGQGGDAQGGAGGGTACTWSSNNNACATGYYCDAPGCGAGTCKPIGTTDDPDKLPVCGCDNVNYWNAAIAAVHGMAVAANGECAVPTICGGIATLACPDDAQSCGYLLGSDNECGGADGAGVCWGMPQTCNQVTVGNVWRACFSSPSDACSNECDAIKTENPYWNDVNGCPI